MFMTKLAGAFDVPNDLNGCSKGRVDNSVVSYSATTISRRKTKNTAPRVRQSATKDSALIRLHQSLRHKCWSMLEGLLGVDRNFETQILSEV